MCQRSEHPALIRFLGRFPEPSIGFISDWCSALGQRPTYGNADLRHSQQSMLRKADAGTLPVGSDAGTLPVTDLNRALEGLIGR